ncbi:MAG: 2'-5' RNA ligase [Nitrospirae bacterium RIFCSPLOWO2_01_FULL_62_17]|nr:MAG: 2'-5' RNA ligase [Nitrospirae bacterium RIFCSPLOWO2_01_FULL_62_17]
MIRTFVAVELDALLRQALAQAQTKLRSQLQRTLGPDVRIQWVKPESVHLTLKFLGDIPEDRVPDVQAALTRAAGGHGRFTVTVEGLGVFPDARAPRVVWVGMTAQAAAVKRLAADVESALGAIGFASEQKPFHPHLTLARIKERSPEVGRAMSAGGLLTPEVKLGELTVAAVSLMKSDLKPSGPVYTRLCHVPLKEA